MPLYLTPPKAGRTPFYRVRGTYLGVRVDRSAETGDRRTAQAFLGRIRDAIERNAYAPKPRLTFAAAATAYMQADGESRFLAPILRQIGLLAAEDISQADVDGCAAKLYPRASAATRNRQVYTPIVAVLKHAGLKPAINRPRGAQGTPRSLFLSPDQFEALARAATATDAEFGALVILLCYTGLRLSEALRLRCDALDVSGATAQIGRTKNGRPRATHLPPRVVAALASHPRRIDRGSGRLFRWSKSGELYLLAERAYAVAAVDHGGAPFHVLRHTYGAWMTRAGADLVGTDAWASPNAARVYQHFVTTEEARKADRLPGASIRALRVRKA